MSIIAANDLRKTFQTKRTLGILFRVGLRYVSINGG